MNIVTNKSITNLESVKSKFLIELLAECHKQLIEAYCIIGNENFAKVADYAAEVHDLLVEERNVKDSMTSVSTIN